MLPLVCGVNYTPTTFVSWDIGINWFNWSIIQLWNWIEKFLYSLLHADCGQVLFAIELSRRLVLFLSLLVPQNYTSIYLYIYVYIYVYIYLVPVTFIFIYIRHWPVYSSMAVHWLFLMFLIIEGVRPWPEPKYTCDCYLIIYW